MTLAQVIWVLVGYLAGSVPFALLLGWSRGVDIRQSGSGNVGATNAGRVLGRKWGFLCFALDVAKGTIPVVAAGLWLNYWGRTDLPAVEAWKWLAVGAAAVVGHVFPIWLRFRGGKGVATGLGVLLGFWPILTIPGLATLVTWVALLLAFRYISLASVVSAVLLPVYLIAMTLAQDQSFEQVTPFLAVVMLLALLVVVRHRSNLVRLREGTEPKIGQRSK